MIAIKYDSIRRMVQWQITGMVRHAPTGFLRPALFVIMTAKCGTAVIEYRGIIIVLRNIPYAVYKLIAYRLIKLIYL